MNSPSDRLLWVQRQLEDMSKAFARTGRPEGKWVGVLANRVRAVHAEVANMEVIERGLPPQHAGRPILRVVS